VPPRAVDQQRLGRAADAGAAHLGVDDDLHGHVEIGGSVDIDVADAFEMREDRHARLVCTRATRLLPPRGTMTSMIAAEPAQHLADGGAVGRRHELDRVFRQAGATQALRPGRHGSPARNCSESEPPRRITALPALRQSAPASAVTLGRLS
jgi:hypothetical protein